MTKQYLIEQIERVYKMIKEVESKKNIELLKQGKRNEISIKVTQDLGRIRYKYNKDRKLESATKQSLLNILEEYVAYGFDNHIVGFDSNFKY